MDQHKLHVLIGQRLESRPDRGRTGRAANWYLQRRAVRNELLNWFVHDGRRTAARTRMPRPVYGKFDRLGHLVDDSARMTLRLARGPYRPRHVPRVLPNSSMCSR